MVLAVYISNFVSYCNFLDMHVAYIALAVFECYSICSSEVIHSPKYSYFKFIFIYSEIISQPSTYTAHNNPKSRISRLDWHV